MNTSSQEWRKECEARDLLTWPLAKRRKQLDLVQEKRGWQARLELQDEMERLWKLTKNQQQQLESLYGKTHPSLEKHQQINLI